MNVIERLRTGRDLKRRIANRRNRLYKVAYAWCGDGYLADDLVQDALARALDKAHQLKDPARLDSWLYSILNNCWREHLRSRRPDVELDEEKLECPRCPEWIAARDDLAERVQELIDKLPMGQRQVVTLIALEEFTYKEVAEALDIPIGTVMSRLARARQFMCERLNAANRVVEMPRPQLRRVK
jgi:RNA polymerase sigma-70 factor (ECF subfamily)